MAETRDQLSDRRVCPECKGEKRVDYGTADAWLQAVYEPCDTCKGTGEVDGMSDIERWTIWNDGRRSYVEGPEAGDWAGDGIEVMRVADGPYETEVELAEQLRGAVGALREIRDRIDKEPDDEMLDDVLAIVDRVLYPATPGGRS